VCKAATDALSYYFLKYRFQLIQFISEEHLKNFLMICELLSTIVATIGQ